MHWTTQLSKSGFCRFLLSSCLCI